MKYCLIGKKLGHSYSREIHQEKGLDYSLVEVDENDVAEFFKNNEYNGFNVTIPYKKDVIPFMSEISSVAKLAGAVNTIVNKNGKFVGYNTDVDGMKYMLSRKGVTLKDKNVLILGSGGTSNTAKTLCTIENAKSVRVVSRNGEINYSNCYNYQDVEIIINTTPVGMYPDSGGCAIDLDGFSDLSGITDVVYNPLKTRLSLSAEDRGIRNVNGLYMLVYQAILARSLFTGKELATEELCDEINVYDILTISNNEENNIVY